MSTPSNTEEKKLAGEAYEFSHTVVRNPSDENLRRLSAMVGKIRLLTANREVESQANRLLAAVSTALKFKTYERRMKEMPEVSHTIYRVAHIER
jgi:hypothetical protein